MAHPLVLQLRFTRQELQRALEAITAEEAIKRFEPMNSLSWIVGHLAAQEQAYWLTHTQGLTPAPEVIACGYGHPASTPPLDEMWSAWHQITEASDEWLNTLDADTVMTHTIRRDKPDRVYAENIGTRLLRATYHYWYHLGESQAIRQMLGHSNLPGFVGDLGGQAPYSSEK